MSAKGLAMACNLDVSLIEEIEAGKELFLPVTIRQKLAKGLKCNPDDIKKLEKDFDTHFLADDKIIESLKELILNGAGRCRRTEVSKMRCPFNYTCCKDVRFRR